MRQEMGFELKAFVLSLLLTSCNSEFSLFDSLSSFLEPSIPPNPTKMIPIDSSGSSQSVSNPQEKGDDGLESLRQLSLAQSQPFVQRRLFNTSCALTVPLFSFTLPQRASQGTSVDLANQAIFGLFSLLVTVLVFTVPMLFTGIRPTDLTGRCSEGTSGILNHLMDSTPIFDLMNADVSNKIGLDSTKCLQKTICEANRYPKNKNYGLLALPFQIFFPPPANGTSEARTSSFQLAARAGKYTKKECGREFKCFFDIMDLAAYLVDWYHYTADPGSYYGDENSN